MKKSIFVLLVLIVLLVVSCSTGENIAYRIDRYLVGRWGYEGTHDVIYEFTSSKEYNELRSGVKSDLHGTYTINGNTVFVTKDTGATLTFVYNEETHKLKQGDRSGYLTKNGA